MEMGLSCTRSECGESVGIMGCGDCGAGGKVWLGCFMDTV
jgi:hypothetical protein